MGRRFHDDMGNYLHNKSAAKAAGMTCTRYRSPFKRVLCYGERVVGRAKEFLKVVASYLRPHDDVDLSNLNTDVMVIKRKEHPLKLLLKTKIAEKRKSKPEPEPEDESVDMSEVNRVIEQGSVR